MQTDQPGSDIDIVVEFYRSIGLKFMSFVEHIERLFNRKVDVLTIEGIRNIRLRKVSSEIERDIVYA